MPQTIGKQYRLYPIKPEFRQGSVAAGSNTNICTFNNYNIIVFGVGVCALVTLGSTMLIQVREATSGKMIARFALTNSSPSAYITFAEPFLHCVNDIELSVVGTAGNTVAWYLHAYAG